MQYDTIIKRGLYLDGSGSEPFIADVAIKDGLIARVSREEITDAAVEIIDATDRWVTPGFIEPHSHYDAEIIAAPELSESVRHGVTTVMTGICSISMVCGEAEDCSDLFTKVEAVPREQVLPLLKTKKTWRSPTEFRDFYEQQPLGPNLATFLGHSDLRADVMGLQRSVSGEKPTDAELNKMEAVLGEALDQGFLGLSTMTTKLDRLDGDRAWAKPLPSTFAKWSEFRRLNRLLRSRGGILQSAPDAVGKLNVIAFLWETMGWFRKQLKTTLLTVMDLKSNPRLPFLTRLSGMVSRYLLRGNLRWQALTSPMIVYAYGLDFNSFGELADGRVLREMKDPDEPYEQVEDPAFRQTLKNNMNTMLGSGLWHRDFSDAWVVECPDAAVIGKNFAEISKQHGKDPVDTFLDMAMKYREEMRWGVQFGNHRPKVMRKIIQGSHYQVGFADSGAHLKNLASYNFPICLLKYVEDGNKIGEKSLSTAAAVRRLTGELADWYGIDAGYIREGDRADVVVVNPAGFTEDVWDMVDAPMPVFAMDRLVNRNDAAVDAVFVNGNLAYSNSQFRDSDGYAPNLGKERVFGKFLPGESSIRPSQPNPTKLNISQAA